jgi:O-antigen/teichoic acid export membrane protein
VTDIKTKVGRGLAWTGLASALVGVIDLLGVAIPVAFWISPSEYGTAMLAVSLFAALDMATDLGLTSALIARDDHTPERLSTVFWLNVGLSLVMFGMIAVGGPLLAGMHGEPAIGGILMLYGGKMILHNTYLVPQALMKKELRFGEIAAIRICANVVELSIKIVSAAMGAGVWFFILGRLGHTVVTAIGTQMCHPWVPRRVLRLRDSREYVRFGLRTSASQILFHTYTNLDFQVVGYYFGTAATGFYHLASTLVLQPVRMVSQVVIDVAFPAYARLHAQRAGLIDQFIAFTRLNLITVLPLLAGVAITAPDLIGMFWGQEWQVASDAARLLCLVGLLRALSFVIPPLLDGVGRPHLTLAYMATAALTLTGLFVLFALVLGDRFGYLSVAIAWVCGYPIAFALLLWLALEVLELPVREYLRRTWGVPACVAVAGLAAWGTHLGLQGVATPLRFAGVLVVLLGGTALLLARFQGITLAFIKASLRGNPR